MTIDRLTRLESELKTLLRIQIENEGSIADLTTQLQQAQNDQRLLLDRIETLERIADRRYRHNKSDRRVLLFLVGFVGFVAMGASIDTGWLRWSLDAETKARILEGVVGLAGVTAIGGGAAAIVSWKKDDES